MKIDYTANDFKDRITIIHIKETKDADLNVKKTMLPIAVVWAKVDVKNASISNSQIGEAGSIRYSITLRYNKALLGMIDAVNYNGRELKLVAPPYTVGNKYILLEALEKTAKHQNICEFHELPQ